MARARSWRRSWAASIRSSAAGRPGLSSSSSYCEAMTVGAIRPGSRDVLLVHLCARCGRLEVAPFVLRQAPLWRSAARRQTIAPPLLVDVAFLVARPLSADSGWCFVADRLHNVVGAGEDPGAVVLGDGLDVLDG